MTRPRAFDHDLAVELFDRGFSIASLAEQYDVSREAIRQVLRRAGRVTRQPMRDAQLASHLAVRVLKLSPEARALFDRLVAKGE